MEPLRNALGTGFFSALVFVAGALVGPSMWRWLNAKLPWNK